MILTAFLPLAALPDGFWSIFWACVAIAVLWFGISRITSEPWVDFKWVGYLLICILIFAYIWTHWV